MFANDHDVLTPSTPTTDFYLTTDWTCRCGCTFRPRNIGSYRLLNLPEKIYGSTLIGVAQCPGCRLLATLTPQPKPAPSCFGCLFLILVLLAVAAVIVLGLTGVIR